jgi:hypothetical protein
MDKETPQNSYFLKRITQTDFRGGKAKDYVKDETHQYIDLLLSPIEGSDELKMKIKEKIIAEANGIVDTLLPEKKAIHVKSSDYLNEVFIRLGIK